MEIALARIDDRFIHGQVTVGWSQILRPDRIVLANNEIAADPWQGRVYKSAVPPGIRVSILSTSQAVAALKSPHESFGAGETGILLVGNPIDMYFIHRHGMNLARINVGGMHYTEGKREMLPFVYVNREELAVFRSFLSSGAVLSAQQLPGAKETLIDQTLIERTEEGF
jgi:mannose/fructose/N-acetylgalactosamine-specific phosphotransferase system component IIB